MRGAATLGAVAAVSAGHIEAASAGPIERDEAARLLIRKAGETDFGQGRAFLVVGKIDPFTAAWSAIALYQGWAGLTARTETSDRPGARFTTEPACPRLAPAAEASRLNAVLGSMALPEARRLLPMTADGTTYLLRVPRAASSGAYATVELSANDGPVSIWGAELFQATTGCWTTNAPR